MQKLLLNGHDHAGTILLLREANRILVQLVNVTHRFPPLAHNPQDQDYGGWL